MLTNTRYSPRANLTTRRQVLSGGALAAAGMVIRSNAATGGAGNEISHTEESIHQERLFDAGPKRIYDALTVTPQFDKIIQLTGVMRSPRMVKMQKPTDISPHVGGSFALFGGYITGRQIELVPNELIVQACRVGSWARGTYSIARFELVAGRLDASGMPVTAAPPANSARYRKAHSPAPTSHAPKYGPPPSRPA